MRIVWEGSQFVTHSLALINREICLQLLSSGYQVSIVPYEKHQFEPDADPRFQKLAERFNATLPCPIDIHVRHQWPPKFIPPSDGHWVMIQPWEYGRLPASWVDPMSNLVDEIWVPSRHVMKSHVGSGIPADRIQVIPNGVNTQIFHPDAKPYSLASKKKFKFLFVGGTIWRKGIDVLLEAYRTVFRRNDEVTLIVKDMGQDTFYRGQGAYDLIRQIQSDPSAPEVVYLTQALSEHEMPGLFTACNCLVHPYRGEGFGLPVLEAMACGVPIIVTAGGATDDFCSPDNAYLIPSKRQTYVAKDIQFAGGAGWVLEPDLDGLKKTLLNVYGNWPEARRKAYEGCEYTRANYSWDKIAKKVVDRMSIIAKRPIRRKQVRH